MDSFTAPPVLFTPAEHILEASIPTTLSTSETRLSEEELYVQYEIPRTIAEIRQGRWKRIALQFPDEMLVDAPRVYERLRDGLMKDRSHRRLQRKGDATGEGSVHQAATDLQNVKLEAKEGLDQQDKHDADDVDAEERLCILADTSYGACCVDEVAAEHVEADVVVHYGRTCLSPTARLPTIYIFTSNTLDLPAVLSSFTALYQDKAQKICLMADIPYHHHLPHLHGQLQKEGYTHLFLPEILHDPSSLLPNRTIPPEVRATPDELKEYSIFHISNPPTSLVLTLASRVKDLQIFPTATTPSPIPQVTSTNPLPLLRRRYALLTSITSAPIIGILLNTLSVSNYMTALSHCQKLITAAGKKSYTFVVGKVNVAKLANFSEVAAWVVISCWESGLLEGLGRDFMAPVVTPFELEVALKGEAGRVYGGEWVGDFSGVLLGHGAEEQVRPGDAELEGTGIEDAGEGAGGNWDDQVSDDEEPDFDLRTGKYVSRSRPMGRTHHVPHANATDSAGHHVQGPPAPPSSALVQRAKGDVVAINGAHSPGAEFLRSKRTWQGLGSDHPIAYERDEDGKIRGAAMEEGRSGVAQGYRVGEEAGKS